MQPNFVSRFLPYRVFFQAVVFTMSRLAKFYIIYVILLLYSIYFQAVFFFIWFPRGRCASQILRSTRCLSLLSQTPTHGFSCDLSWSPHLYLVWIKWTMSFLLMSMNNISALWMTLNKIQSYSSQLSYKFTFNMCYEQSAWQRCAQWVVCDVAIDVDPLGRLKSGLGRVESLRIWPKKTWEWNIPEIINWRLTIAQLPLHWSVLNGPSASVNVQRSMFNVQCTSCNTHPKPELKKCKKKINSTLHF